VIAWSDKDGSISGDLLHQGEKLLICCSIVVVQIIGNIPSNHDSVDVLLSNDLLQIVGDWGHYVDVGLNYPPVGKNYHVDVPILRPRVGKFNTDPLIFEGSWVVIGGVVPAEGGVLKSFLEGNFNDGADLNISNIIICKLGSLHCFTVAHDSFVSTAGEDIDERVGAGLFGVKIYYKFFRGVLVLENIAIVDA
jgi:hypothetical protein